MSVYSICRLCVFVFPIGKAFVTIMLSFFSIHFYMTASSHRSAFARRFVDCSHPSCIAAAGKQIKQNIFSLILAKSRRATDSAESWSRPSMRRDLGAV